jgi:transposase-like protein
MKKENLKRTFDLSLKLDLVKQIERGELRVSEVSKIYGLSATAIYKWLYKYSEMYKKQTRVIVEQKSLSKKNADLQRKIELLERSLGQKQLRIDYLEKVVEVASEEMGVDIEKKSKRLS